MAILSISSSSVHCTVRRTQKNQTPKVGQTVPTWSRPRESPGTRATLVSTARDARVTRASSRLVVSSRSRPRFRFARASRRAVPSRTQTDLSDRLRSFPIAGYVRRPQRARRRARLRRRAHFCVFQRHVRGACDTESERASERPREREMRSRGKALSERDGGDGGAMRTRARRLERARGV